MNAALVPHAGPLAIDLNQPGTYLQGQPWLWLYQLWYQVPGFSTSHNANLIAIYLTGLATLLLLAVPFIPGLRDIPRLIPVHRLVWRSWHSSAPEPGADSSQAGASTAGKSPS